MSKHGATEKVVNKISELLHNDEVAIMNLANDRNPDISEFKQILIGGSIHAGMIQKRVKDFCVNNMSTLLQNELGLFLCGMMKDKQEEQYLTSFPKELREHAKGYALPGGEFTFNEMNFLEKLIVKKVSGINGSVSDLDFDSIKDFVKKMQN